jgi:signal peptidase I
MTVNKSINIKFWTVFATIFWIVLISILLFKLLVFQQVTVVGPSMEPNYHTGETLLVNQLDRNFQRGQVVAVYRDKEIAKNADYFTRYKAVFYLKRIIGLPGERIAVLEDKVIIYNDSDCQKGCVLSEDYISNENKEKLKTQNYFFPITKVPDKEYFLMGDNRTNSTDSRIIGTFPDYSIFGIETLRFWPIGETTLFFKPNYTYETLSEENNLKIERASQGSIDLENNMYF